MQGYLWLHFAWFFYVFQIDSFKKRLAAVTREKREYEERFLKINNEMEKKVLYIEPYGLDRFGKAFLVHLRWSSGAQLRFVRHLSPVRLSWTLHIFYFYSETAEWNSVKLERKQDLNILYQVCVFWADRKTKWLPQPLIGWDLLDFYSETAERNSTKLDWKQDLNLLYKVCFLQANWKNKMVFSASTLKLLNGNQQNLEQNQCPL